MTTLPLFYLQGGKQPMSSNMDDSDDEFELGSAGDSELEKVRTIIMP